MTDPTRSPVVIGGGQVTNREEDPEASPSPFDLMVEAASKAMTDAGRCEAGGASGPASWTSRLTHLWMVHSISLRHSHPAEELSALLGAPARAEVRCSGMGGNIPQWLANRAADLVATGARPVVLIVGAEALATKRRAARQGSRLDWPSADGWPDMWPPLEPDMGVNPLEDAHGLRQATTMYALVEPAVANTCGEGPSEHQRAIGELMAGLNAVASQNPYSWFVKRRTARELLTPTEDNRMICVPYPKYLNAVMDVDMSAAVLITDAQTARDVGIDPGSVAHLRGWADSTEVWHLSTRPAVSRSPALERCVESALGSAGLALDELGAFDLYSCFPSSVEVARKAFGIPPDDDRQLTLTGGLPYHGGPGSNYVTHAICNALDHLRSGGDPVAVHGNGYYLTKHAVGIYSAEPPPSSPDREPSGSDREPRQPGGDEGAQPQEVLELDAVAPASGSICAWTVPYSRDGSREQGIVLADTAAGHRTLARADDELTAYLVEAEHDVVGETVTFHRDGKQNLAGAG